jgi:eukaryotic-like serine/threonine-protein kinase
VASGARIDWEAAASVRSGRQRVMLRELEMLGRLMDVHVSESGAQASVAGERSPSLATESTPSRWGSFELLECIGSGNFGSVYRAHDRLDREVAVKLLHHEAVDRGRLLDEAKRLARVRHPNVVHVYGADEAAGVAGFWMELIAGDTLSALVAQHGPFGAEEAAAIGRTLCAALAAVHGVGLIHQDVKARNVMRERGDRAGRYVLRAGARRPTWLQNCSTEPRHRCRAISTASACCCSTW